MNSSSSFKPLSTMQADIFHCLSQAASSSSKWVWVAYSGGLDSQVLLHLIHALKAQLAPLQVRAVHVHHGLNSRADAWVEHCRQSCERLEIPCEIMRVHVPQETGESLEAVAREARYEAFVSVLGTDDLLLTAQHADDQAETLLLQLLRGAGAPGLASMPTRMVLGKGQLLRPLLKVRRSTLLAYAQQQDLQWIEDDSNQDQRFDRNFLRQDILPRLEQRWPATTRVLCRAAQHQADNAGLLLEWGREDVRACAEGQGLSIEKLQLLSATRQNNALRTWLFDRGLTAPPTHLLQQIGDEVLRARTDRQPCIHWAETEVRRYRGVLYAMPSLPPVPPHFSAQWVGAEPPALPLGRLSLQSGGELRWPLDHLSIRLRQGGETCRWRGHQQALKKILQASDMPTWLRAFLPLLYQGDTLVGIPGIAVCDECYVAQKGGVALHWLL